MIQNKTIISSLPNVLKTIDIPFLGKKQSGKVRDFYVLPDKRIIITTDRQSAFDVILGFIPYKGAVLNQLAAFWFEQTKHIISNHMIALPDPNVLVAKNCQGINIEMIVRGYMSGVTKTSIWYSYEKGERFIYGQKFPDGLKKNQQLPKPVITPTTHGGGKGGHDERLTREEIIKKGLVSKKLYQQMENVSLKLFAYGSALCKKKGLILVDTKYEFGLYDGKLMLMDEIHTPDSSRFWVAKTYQKKFSSGEEPENFDKEFLRLWYSEKGYRGDGVPPKMSKELIVALAKRYIAVYEKITGKKFKMFNYPIEKRVQENIKKYMSSGIEKITYSEVGDNYETKDPVKKLIQIAASKTGKNLKKHGYEEVAATRGESAFVWKQGNVYMASVIEGLGTKNLIADNMYKATKKSYYDVIAHDTVATIINDLVTVGAMPLVVYAYWGIEDNRWLYDTKRMKDFVDGWAKACTISGATWGGGETATVKQILLPNVVELAGSAIGIINSKKRLITDKNLKIGDRIILIKSNGVNANGISLARAIAERLPKGYVTKLANGKMYGEALLTKSNIYAKVVTDLLDKGITIHYISNITGHGLRKIMRARREVTYTIQKILKPQDVFSFIQKHAGLSDREMYETYNMGMDYAIFIPKKDVDIAIRIIKKNGFHAIDAGVVEKGPRQVVIEPLGIILKGESLDLRV